MSEFIFCRIGDHYAELPSEEWKGNERLFRLIYLSLLDNDLVVPNQDEDLIYLD